jgi:hypothetical protein
MEQNSLLEIGSKVNIVISFNSATSINNNTYAAGEPYLYLKDANAVIRYKQLDKSASAGPNKIANSQIYPQEIIVRSINMNRKLLALLLNYDTTQTNVGKREFISLLGEDDIIYLPEEVNTSSTIYLYDSSFNPVVFTYNSVKNALEGTAIAAGAEYLISYSSVLTATRFNLCQPSVPYMSLEIQSVGNINKVTKNTIMYFNKVSLSSIMEFNFLMDNKINIPLEFKVIDGSGYIIFED